MVNAINEEEETATSTEQEVVAFRPHQHQLQQQRYPQQQTPATKAIRTSRGVNKTIKILTLRNLTQPIHKAIQEMVNFVVTAKY